MTLALHQIDLTISDEIWTKIDAYARELDVSPDAALEQLLGELLAPIDPRKLKLYCDSCKWFHPHKYEGTKPSGITAREQLYRCTRCGTPRRYGLV